MSTNQHTNPAYISHVHLKGYKSIIDTKVELHPGLNIIIGPNGSGKTNFLEFLRKIMNVKFDDLPKKIEGELKFYFNNNDNKHTWNFKRVPKFNKNTIEQKLIEKLSFSNSVDIIDSEINYGEHSFPVPNILTKWYEIAPIFISFGLPDEIINLYKSISYIGRELHIDSIEGITVYLENHFTPKLSKGVKEILKNILLPMIPESQRIKIEAQDLLSEIKINLKRFTPISSLRIMPSPELRKDGETYRANYLNFEFLVENNWLSWNQLSDGTKRLFYIISEVTSNEGICLIEEPELGTYPEQLDQIMLFLKEQAQDKQIILTTHAPRVLDHLKDEELNRIIITKYEKDQGTKMRHLSDEDIQYVIEFRENEGYTSDLWTMTDFFEEEEETI